MTPPRIVITSHGIHNAHGGVTDKYAYTTTTHQHHTPNRALDHTNVHATNANTTSRAPQ